MLQKNQSAKDSQIHQLQEKLDYQTIKIESQAEKIQYLNDKIERQQLAHKSKDEQEKINFSLKNSIAQLQNEKTRLSAVIEDLKQGLFNSQSKIKELQESVIVKEKEAFKYKGETDRLLEQFIENERKLQFQSIQLKNYQMQDN